MIERIIFWLWHNHFFVWLSIIMIVIGGDYSNPETSVNVLSDLSENHVIVFMEWMGRTPQCLMFIIPITLLALLYCGSGSSNLENI
ncbi:MAG: hypothetical protein KAX50_07145 [Saprospiraceae bacterium]|nr:hypothetical protein [Saprospiraceae bacterium]